jgi:endonuclease/exonuclease/phosphatase family metal-dependent hydrolase
MSSPVRRSRIRRALLLGAAACFVFASLSSVADAATAPKAPTDLAAKTTARSATLTWTAASGATHYRACIAGQSCAALKSQTTGTSWKFSSLSPGHRYSFTVYSYNSHGRAQSTALSVTLPKVPLPEAPTGITQTVRTTTLTISWKAAAHASAYTVCLMTSEDTEKCTRSSSRSSALTTKFTGLTPTGGADYFYRVIASNSAGTARSAKQRADLPVVAMSGVEAPKVRTTSIHLAWSAALNAETYTIEVATNSAMTSNLKTYSVDGASRAYVVTKLTPGTIYYVRMDGRNGRVHGAYSVPLAVPLPTASVAVNVVTYNLCGQDHCRTGAEKNRIKAWSTRKPYAGKIARSTGADLIATQESGHSDTKFITQLPGYSEGAYLSAKSIFYKTSRFTSLDSGTITLDKANKRYAVWNEFLDKSTRTPFYFVDPHLEPYKGKKLDDLRYAQTKVLIAAIAAENTKHLPVIYAGDFNSNKDNADQSKYAGGYDAPLKAFKAVGIPDAITIAADLLHTVFNSANQAINPPYKYGDHVDHIYVSPGVRVNKLSVVLGPNAATGSESFRYATPFASDHNPVQANVTVQGRPGEVG